MCSLNSFATKRRWTIICRTNYEQRFSSRFPSNLVSVFFLVSSYHVLQKISLLKFVKELKGGESVVSGCIPSMECTSHNTIPNWYII